MPELNEQDLRTLFRTAGHHSPGDDLSQRIMARVAVTPMLRPMPVEPLIGARGWVTIAVLGALLIVVLLWNAPRTGASPSPVSEFLRSGWERFQVPLGDWTIWLACGSFCLLLIKLADLAISRRVVTVRR